MKRFLLLLLIATSAKASFLPGTAQVTTLTATAIANISATGTVQCQYIRIGDVVNLGCRAPLTCTTGSSTITTFDISLPVASDLTATGDLTGIIAANPSIGDGAGICTENIASDRATCTFACGSTSSLIGRRLLINYTVK